MENFKVNPPIKHVLCVSGSPRKNGNSDVLLDSIMRGVESVGVQSRNIYLRDLTFQSCIGCERCRRDKTCTGLNDDMGQVYTDIINSQGLILISPAHNYNVSALTKAFIDRMYRFYNFDDNRPRNWNSQLAHQNRKALIAGVCEQTDKKDMGFTIEAMRMPLAALGYEIIDELAVYGIFDRGQVKEHQDLLQKAETLGKKLAQSIL